MRIYLVVGGSASGKSAFAGRLAEQLAKRTNPTVEHALFFEKKEDQDPEKTEQQKPERGKKRGLIQDAPILYIATLADQGEESLKKVARHRELRKSGNYTVAECFSFRDLRACCEKGSEQSEQKNGVSEDASPQVRGWYPVVLFDSLDGFTANIMFRSKELDTKKLQKEVPSVIAEKTVREILGLERICDHLVIVSDHVYSDGILYDEFTSRYMEYTSSAEQLLAEQAEYVTEVVCGIPVLLKGNRDELSEIIGDYVVSLYEDSDAVS